MKSGKKNKIRSDYKAYEKRIYKCLQLLKQIRRTCKSMSH